MEWCRSECGKYRIESLTATTIPGALHVRLFRYSKVCPIDIISARGDSLLNIGLPFGLPYVPIGSDLHPTSSGDLYKFVCSPCTHKVIKKGFCEDETVCIGTEVNINPIASEELLELSADAALDGTSVVAVEIATGEVVAACFNKLQVSTSESTEKSFFDVFAEERCTQDSSKALIQFMAEVDGRCNFFEKYGVDCSLELMFLATLREHRRKKLGLLLCKASLDLGRKLKHGPVSHITLQDLGPKYAHMKPRSVTTKIPAICQALWTSIGTQKIGKSLNFTVHLRVPFTEFVYKGKNYPERVGFDPYCEAVAQSLD